MIRKTPHVDLERIAPTAKLVYAGPFDRAHLDFSVVPYRGADRVIQEVIQSTSQKWSEIQDDGKPRFSDFNTCGLQ
ncbi:MAG: hypothetical protein KGH64_06190, partial [Candidatus Micrarchaeota archaeon]|nr:hypothetical protein [Candidatus Micrarchaeota archaeon]